MFVCFRERERTFVDVEDKRRNGEILCVCVCVDFYRFLFTKKRIDPACK